MQFITSLSGDDVDLNVDLEGLNEKAEHFHVHMLPVAMADVVDTKSSTDCSIVKGHYEYKDEANRKIWPGELSDDYEFTFRDSKQVNQNFQARPHQSKERTDGSKIYFEGRKLSGPHSMIGRSIVIHHKRRSSRWVCATILEDVAYQSVQWKFSTDIVGTVEFLQNENDPRGETTVFVNITSKDDQEYVVGEEEGCTKKYDWQLSQTLNCAQEDTTNPLPEFPCCSLPCTKVITMEANKLPLPDVKNKFLSIFSTNDQPAAQCVFPIVIPGAWS